MRPQNFHERNHHVHHRSWLRRLRRCLPRYCQSHF
nr:MAG TPA: hypothetical protein [Caudoviricetes sp.]